METKTLTKTLKALVALAMLQSPFISEEALAKGATCSSRKACEDAYSSAQTSAGALSQSLGQMNTGGANGGGATLGSASQGTATIACSTQQTCETAKKQCDKDVETKKCKPDDCTAIEQTASKAAIDCAQASGVAAGSGKTQSAAAGGGDGSQMMGMLAGAAMGAMAAMAMQKKKKDDQPPPVDPNAAWNGVQLDCSKMDAFQYQACNSQMEVKCAPQMDEPTCVQFEARYCMGQGTGTVAPPVVAAMPQVDPTTGAIMGTPALGQPGEGIGSQFCQNNVAYNFCKGAGRQGCPSCLRLQQNSSAICAQNPAACMATNSSAELVKASQTCPTDPAFANPGWATGGTPTGGGTTFTAGGAAVVLPQSVGSNSSGGPAVSGAYGEGGALNGGIPASANGAIREGQAANFNGATSGAGLGGASTGSAGFNGGTGSSRELAGSGRGFQMASVNGVPSSEVQAAYSQSLFVTSSQVIRNRCNSGRLNCP